MTQWLIAAFARYGYAVVPAGIYLESLGVPVPGEAVLLAAGFFARQGSLALGNVMALAAAAAILGDNTGYWIGRLGGRGLLERHGRLVGLSPARLGAIDGFFARQGAKTVLFARFVSGLRLFAPILAGVTGIPWRRFALFEAVGAVVWAVVISSLGFSFGQSWHLVERWLGRAGLALIALAATGLLVRQVVRHGGRSLRVEAWQPRRLAFRELLLVAVQLLGFGVLVVIGRAVSHRRSEAFDQAVSGALQGLAGSWMDPIMRVADALGSAPATAAVVLAAAWWCWRRGERTALRALIGVLAASIALAADLALAFHASRPAPGHGFDVLYDFGFPSGYAVSAVAVYGFVGFLVARAWPRWRAAVVALVALLALAIGCARVYLGWQWPADVLAGYAAGMAILGLGIHLLERAEAGRLPGGPATGPGIAPGPGPGISPGSGPATSPGPGHGTSPGSETSPGGGTGSGPVGR